MQERKRTFGAKKGVKTTIIIILSLFLTSCKPNIQQVIDSFAIIDTPNGNGSGFSISDKVVITACHVVKESYGQPILIKNIYNEAVYTTRWYCDQQRDIAYLFIKRNIFKKHLKVAVPEEGLQYGCYFGKCKNDTAVCNKCRMANVIEDKITFIGGNAVLGMSGGPCVVKAGSETYVIGVISISYQPNESYETERTNLGAVTCTRFDNTVKKVLVK